MLLLEILATFLLAYNIFLPVAATTLEPTKEMIRRQGAQSSISSSFIYFIVVSNKVL
jgi:hypothetical protein